MFGLLDYRESLLIFRGILVLAIIIFLGVGAAEEQLNTLTQRQEHILAFRLTYDSSGIYRIYINETTYQISAVYPLGNIINHERKVTLRTAGYQVVILKYIELDCRKELVSLDLYLKRMKEKFNLYYKAFR